jgi:hypothetical protein
MLSDYELHTLLVDEYVRMCGYDPSQGPWILVVLPDGTTEFEVFKDEKDMWCNDPVRVGEVVDRITAMKAKGWVANFPCVRLPFDPRDRSTWPALPKWPKDQ